jgi:3-mercaptopyruvate sulfurtransferase SseA
MIKRNLIIYIAAGALVGGVIGWTAMRQNGTRVAASSERPGIPLASTRSPQTVESVPRIDARQLNARLARGEVVLIDVRAADAYMASHIAGAMHIPVDYIEGELSYLPRGKPIVAYCT